MGGRKSRRGCTSYRVSNNACMAARWSDIAEWRFAARAVEPYRDT